MLLLGSYDDILATLTVHDNVASLIYSQPEFVHVNIGFVFQISLLCLLFVILLKAAGHPSSKICRDIL